MDAESPPASPARTDDDVEDVETGPGKPWFGKSSTLKTIYVRTNITQTSAEEFESLGYNPVIRKGHIHGHPVMAYGRAHLEKVAIRLAIKDHRAYGDAEASILAIAPNVGREHEHYPSFEWYESNVWNQIPNVHPNDAGRVARARELGMTNWCGCLAGECGHCAKVSVVYSVHAVYYYQDRVADIIKASGTRVGYFVYLIHDGTHGTRYKGESVWSLDELGRVHERVTGNLQEYVHAPVHWLTSGGFVAADGTWVSVELVDRVGDTVLVRARYTGRAFVATTTDAATFRKIVLGHTPADPGVWHATDDTVAAQVKVSGHLVYGHNMLLRITTEDVVVSLDREVMGEVAASVVGRDRTDPQTRADAIHRARSGYRRKKFPGPLVPRAVTYTAELALWANITEETNLLATSEQTFTSIARVHRQLMQWGNVAVVGIWKWFLAVVFAIALAVALWFLVPYEHHATTWVVLVGLFVASLAWCISVWFYNSHLGEIGRTWTSYANRGDARSVSSPTTITQPLLTGLRETDVETPPTRADGWIDVDWTRDRKHPSKPPAMLAVEGIATTREVPLPFEANTHNERLGVMGRILKLVPEIGSREIELVKEALEMAPQFEPLRRLNIDWDVDLWPRWLSGRPAWQRNDLVKARARLLENGYNAKTGDKKKAFLKIEKTLGNVTADGGGGKTPRIIQALSDEEKAFRGPSIWWFCQHVKKAFNRAVDGVRFTSGLNAETIGSKIQDDYNRFGDAAVFLVMDYSRFDAHCGHGYKEVTGVSMFWCGVPAEIRAATLQSRPRGTTPHGVYYATDHGLCSGAPETSDMGSLWNAVVTLVAFLVTMAKWWTVQTVDAISTNFMVVVNAQPLYPAEDDGSDGEERLPPRPIPNWLYKTVAVAAYTGIQNRMSMNVLGDDGCHIVRAWWPEAEDQLVCDKLAEELVSFGLKAEPTIYRQPWQVKYASHLFIPDDTGRWRMSPMPGRVVAKMGYRRIGPGVCNLAADLACVWMDAAHVPILNTYLSAMRRLVKEPARGRPDDYEHKIHSGAIGKPGPDSWAYMEARYGLTREDDERLRKALDAVGALPCVITNDVLDRLMEVDL